MELAAEDNKEEERRMLVESMGLETEVNCIVKSIHIEQSPITHIATPLTLPDIVVTQIAPSSIVASSAP